MKRIVLVLVPLLLLVEMASAQSNSETAQTWSFESAPGNFNNMPPDFADNPFGNPMGTTPAASWGVDQGDGALFIPPGLYVDFVIPNDGHVDRRKNVLANFVYRMVNSQGNPIAINPAQVTVTGGGGNVAHVISASPQPGSGPGTMYLLMRFDLSICPTQETVHIPGPPSGGSLYLKNVDIHTNCPAVPGTGPVGLAALALLLGSASLFTLRWRRSLAG